MQGFPPLHRAYMPGMTIGTGMAVMLPVGVALGVLFENIAAGIGIGVALGIALSLTGKRKA